MSGALPLQPLPLLDEEALADAKTYKMEPHTVQRVLERGIGAFEVLAAIAQPQTKVEKPDGRVEFYRGDLKVVAIPTKKVVITAVDIQEKLRTVPRQPLTPPVVEPACNCRKTHTARKRRAA